MARLAGFNGSEFIGSVSASIIGHHKKPAERGGAWIWRWWTIRPAKGGGTSRAASKATDGRDVATRNGRRECNETLVVDQIGTCM